MEAGPTEISKRNFGGQREKIWLKNGKTLKWAAKPAARQFIS